jgi:hypothetical protein
MAQAVFVDEAVPDCDALLLTQEHVQQHRWKRVALGGVFVVGLLAVLACIAGSARSGVHHDMVSEVIEAAGVGTAGNGGDAQEMKEVLKHAKEVQKQVWTSLLDASQTTREEALKMLKGGKSIKEIKAKGYTSANLGCHSGHGKAAVEKCLNHLKSGFNPAGLLELLDLHSDDDLLMMSKVGLPVKTSGFKKGAKVLMCWNHGKEEGCTHNMIDDVSNDKVSFKHVKVDPSTGTGTYNGYHFSVYSLHAWK